MPYTDGVRDTNQGRDLPMRKGLVFCSGFIVGVFAGWVLGILSAPQSGRETLGSLGERAIELKGRAVQTAEQVRQFVRQADETAGIEPA
jgi:gas vesicle protein